MTKIPRNRLSKGLEESNKAIKRIFGDKDLDHSSYRWDKISKCSGNPWWKSKKRAI